MNESKMDSWIKALFHYRYPVDLRDYRGREFPGYFTKLIAGDMQSTGDFENYFRANARTSKVVYYEVIFWKLYSLLTVPNPDKREDVRKNLERMIANMERNDTSPKELCDRMTKFVKSEDIKDLKRFRPLLGIEGEALTVALTFPAFLNPEKYPMIDRNVAQWVNENLDIHNQNRQCRLSRFNQPTSLTDVDFENYVNWVYWCRETAQTLSKDYMHWRTRDVEMAVFSAQRSRYGMRIELPPL